MKSYRLCTCSNPQIDVHTGKCETCNGYPKADRQCTCTCHRDEDSGTKLNVVKYLNPTCKVSHALVVGT